jgi:glutaredoxin-like YruB-family protein
MTVKVYTTPTCPYCYTLKEFLKEHNIEFEDIDISKDEKVKDDIIKRSGAIGAPIIEVDGEIVVGFDKGKIVKLLGIDN